MSKTNSIISNPKKPAPQDWHKADIICGLWKLGTSMQKLSRENGYKSGSLRLAITMPWPRAERIIAEALGVRPHQIWPSRYHADGSPKSGRGERGLGRYKRKGSTRPGAVNVHSAEAA
jgi:Ner family transcriptional regulator